MGIASRVPAAGARKYAPVRSSVESQVDALVLLPANGPAETEFWPG
jgi:hypothetical protein